MPFLNPSTSTASAAANTNVITLSGIDLTAVTIGMTISFGSRTRVTGDQYLIAAVAPNGTTGGTVTLLDSVPALTNAPFIIDTTGFTGTDATYLIQSYLTLLNTLNTLLSPNTNLFSGSRQLAFDKSAATALSRLIYSTAGRTWADLSQRTLTYTPTGGSQVSAEVLSLRAFLDGTTATDALMVDLTTGGVDVRKASATMASAATVDLSSAPTGKVALTGSATITSFGLGKHLERLVHVVDGGAVLTHNATSLILPGSAPITTKAGDCFHATSDGSGNWRVRSYSPADGAALQFGAPESTIASAATADIGAANSDAIAVTGTTAITSFGTRTNRRRFLRFTGALTLTHNATSLILPTGANITTANGDTAIAASDASGNWRVISYTKADGTQLLVNGIRFDAAQTLTAAQQAQARANAGINSAGALSFRNRIRNGDFSVNQRSVSGTVTLAAGAYGHDGWKGGGSGGTYTFSGSTLTITANTLQQVIEGPVYLPEGGTYMLSWAGSAQARINGGAYAASPITVSGLTAGANATIEFGTGTVSLVQFEPGTAATPFERRDDEVRRCHRYFRRYGGAAFCKLGFCFAASSTVLAGSIITQMAPMRSTPSLFAAGSFSVNGGNAVSVAASSIFIDQATALSPNISITGLSGLSGFYLLQANGDANAYIDLSAEL